MLFDWTAVVSPHSAASEVGWMAYSLQTGLEVPVLTDQLTIAENG